MVDVVSSAYFLNVMLVEAKGQGLMPMLAGADAYGPHRWRRSLDFQWQRKFCDPVCWGVVWIRAWWIQGDWLRLLGCMMATCPHRCQWCVAECCWVRPSTKTVKSKV